MQLVENSVWNFDINMKPALNQLGELEERLSELKKKQSDLTRGTKEYAEAKAEIKALEAEIKQVRETMGLAGMTVKQLTDYQKALNKEIRDLVPGTDAYIQKTQELKEVNTRLSDVRRDVRAVSDEATKGQSVWSNVGTWIKSAFTITAIIEAGRAVYNWVNDSVQEFRKFNSAAQELSAVTGAVGKDLEYYKAQAREVGPAVGKSAAEMLEAYKLMGSAKPDLLSNAEALASVTKEAVTLSQAGKIDLADATNVMASSLNQFKAPASDAARYINVIAAGAKEGSAEIKDMGFALKASGTVAAAAGVSFEQTNAVLQSMSTIALKGEQAGTMLRNVLLTLQSSSDDLNPKVVGLEKALDNLGKKNLSTAELAKMFGKENVVAAQHILQNRDAIDELTEKLTGTNEAYTQAAKNNDTLDFKMQQAKATIANVGVELGEKLAPYIIKAMDGFGKFITVVADVVRGLNPFLAVISMIWDVVGNLVGSIGRSIAIMLNLDEKSNVTQTVMRALAVVFGVVGAAAASLVAMVQLVIDGLLFLSGKISFDQLKANATNNFNAIKAGLKATFVDSYAAINAEATKAAGTLEKNQGDARAAAAKAAADKIAAEEEATHKTTLSKKELADAKHRADAVAKAKKQAEDEAADRLQATEATQDKITQIQIAAIADEKTRKKAQLEFELNEKLEANAKSKADDLTKVNYEIALRNDYKNKVEQLEADYRAKHVAEEKKRLDEIERLEAQQRDSIQQKEYQATRQTLEYKLSNERLNVDQRRTLQLQLIELERQHKLAQIEEIAQKERAKAEETSQKLLKLAGDDAAKRKEIEDNHAKEVKAIDDKLLAEKEKANKEYNDKIEKLDYENLEKRKQQRSDFFAGIKKMLDLDFSYFTQILDKKYQEELKKNAESIKAWIKRGVEYLEIASQVVGLLQAINQKHLEKQLFNINKEKTAQLASWEEQYKKGIINKDQYEKGVDKINKDADAREKEVKMKAWKREQQAQIAMALIHAAMAALKSLATMGWPLGLIGVAASAVMAGVQIAAIKRQQPPTFKQGGKLLNGGIPDGPAHGSEYGRGGIALVRRDTGHEVGEMEGGEPIMILSRNTRRNNGRIINALLESSLHRNGAPIFRNGGLMFLEGGMMDDSGFREDVGGGSSSSGDASFDSGGDNGSFDGGSDTGSYDGGGDYNADGGDAGEMTSETKAQIDESMQLMEGIEKNTKATALSADDLVKLHTTGNDTMAQILQQLIALNTGMNLNNDRALTANELLNLANEIANANGKSLGGLISRGNELLGGVVVSQSRTNELLGDHSAKTAMTNIMLNQQASKLDEILGETREAKWAGYRAAWAAENIAKLDL